MRYVYAAVHPTTGRTLFVAVADRDPAWVVQARHHLHPQQRQLLDDLTDDPVVRVLEESDAATYAEVASIRMRWIRQLCEPKKRKPRRPPERTCVASTMSGEPCRGAAMTGSDLCHYHRRGRVREAMIGPAGLTPQERQFIMNLPPAMGAARHWVGESTLTAPLPVEPRYDCEPTDLDVPSSVIAMAIRLRTELLTFADIAGRLTRLGQPAGHTWTPCEVRHVISEAFYA